MLEPHIRAFLRNLPIHVSAIDWRRVLDECDFDEQKAAKETIASVLQILIHELREDQFLEYWPPVTREAIKPLKRIRKEKKNDVAPTDASGL